MNAEAANKPVRKALPDLRGTDLDYAPPRFQSWPMGRR